MSNGLLILSIALLIVGILMIVKGSDIFVAAAVKLSRAIGVSELVIGATVVSIGTTLPEIITSITAVSMELVNGGGEYMPIAIGNSIGSMCCNIGLVMALVAIIRPIKCDKTLAPKIIILILTSVFITIAIAFGSLKLWHSIILIILFAVFMAENIISSNKKARKLPLAVIGGLNNEAVETIADEKVILSGKQKFYALAAFLLGALIVAGGAYITVDNIEKLCVVMKIPSQIIGVTVVAVGTSLPELATSITALRKGNRDIGVGNVIGANIINGTLLLGLIGIISGGVQIDSYTSSVGIFFMLAIVIVGIVPSLFTRKVARWQGIGAMLLYIAMITVNVIYIV